MVLDFTLNIIYIRLKSSKCRCRPLPVLITLKNTTTGAYLSPYDLTSISDVITYAYFEVLLTTFNWSGWIKADEGMTWRDKRLQCLFKDLFIVFLKFLLKLLEVFVISWDTTEEVTLLLSRVKKHLWILYISDFGFNLEHLAERRYYLNCQGLTTGSKMLFKDFLQTVTCPVLLWDSLNVKSTCLEPIRV